MDEKWYLTGAETTFQGAMAFCESKGLAMASVLTLEDHDRASRVACKST